MKMPSLKFIAGIFAAFLAFAIWFFGFYLKGRAEAEWQAAHSELLARGEKLTVADFVPEKVPDDRNFFADPLWTELSDRVSFERMGVPYSKTRTPSEKWRISALQKEFSDSEKSALEAEFPEFASLDQKKSRLAVIRSRWDKAKKSENSQRAAEFVLRALAPGKPVVARLRELSERPDAFFPLEYQDGAFMGIEHVVPILHASQWLDLHASASLAQGQKAGAFRDVHLIFRLAEALNREQVLLVVLVEMTTVRLGCAVVNRGIKTHSWSEGELQEVERRLARVDMPARVAQGFRFERASMLETTMPLLEKKGMSFLSLASGLGERGWVQDTLAYPMLSAYRAYWMPGDKAFYSRSIQQWIDALDQAPSEGLKPEFFPDSTEAYLKANPSGWRKFRRIVSLLSLPALENSFVKAANVQAEVSMTRIAMALERYRMGFGKYPENLNMVVPDFLAKLPPDPVTMRPFSYRLEESGAFVLWSVGWNGTDENGTPGEKPAEGDWVWGK